MDASTRILNTETNSESDFIRLVAEVAAIPAVQAEKALAFSLKYKLVRRNKSEASRLICR